MTGLNNELIAMLALGVIKDLKRIISAFPDGNDRILQHLVSATIHVTLFMRDFQDIP